MYQIIQSRFHKPHSNSKRTFYRCKECCSEGELYGVVGVCPVCQSNHVRLFDNEYRCDQYKGKV